MKKIYIAILFLSVHSYFCRAQSPGSRLERIEVLKMAYITKELNLTPDEAQKFWPVYNNYTQEIRAARQNCSSDPVACEEKMVGIKKKYRENFRKVLNSDERANKFYNVEANFGNRLRTELQNRQRLRRPGGIQQNIPPN